MNRYKYYSLLILAICALGCSQKIATDLPKAKPSEQVIIFEEPVVQPITKVSYAPFSNSDFVVCAKRYTSTWVTGTTTWTGGELYIPNIVINNPNAYNEPPRHGWSGDKRYYWPYDSFLAFQAYSPSGCGASFDEVGGSGVIFPNCTVATDGTQADIMYSDRVVNASSNANVSSDLYGVQLTFHHILAGIVFRGKTTEDYGTTKIRIKDIKLGGLYTTGDFAQNLSNDGSSHGTALWSNIVETAMTAGTYYADPVIDENYALGVVASGENFSPIYVLPQDFTSNDNATLHITYTVQVAGGAMIEQSFERRLNELTYSDGNGTRFYMGKKYIYNIEIGLSPIHFTPQCSLWIDEELEGSISDY